MEGCYCHQAAEADDSKYYQNQCSGEFTVPRLAPQQHLGAEPFRGSAPPSSSWVWYHPRVLGPDLGHSSRFAFK